MDSLIRYVANLNYWEGPVPTKHLIFSIINVEIVCETTKQ